MDDLISRQAAIDVLKANYPDAHYSELREAVDLAIKVLEEPGRKKGKWIGKPIAGYCTVRCSVCKSLFLENSGGWNFCPECGADMRGENR